VETLNNVKAGVHDPKGWLKGDGIPPDHITPWELLLFFFNRAFGDMSKGFTDKQDFLYKEVFRIPANKISVAGVVSSVWDAVNDPLLGSWMDKKRFGPQQLRLIMRISAVTGSVFAVLKLFDGGMSVWQHLGLLMFCNMTQDIIGTMQSVADQKMRAGISPLSQQRGRVNVWGNMGYQFTWIIGNLPTVLMGFREVFGLTDYQIIFIGSCILLPFAITAHILPSFVKQRVDYSKLSGEVLSFNVPEGESDGESAPESAEDSDGGIGGAREIWKEEPIEQNPLDEVPKRNGFMQNFQVIKYNKYFIANSIASFITVFSPESDEQLLYRYLMPTYKVFGKPMYGDALLLLKQMLSGNLSTVLQPFWRQIINRLGGPLRAQQIKALINIFCKLMMYLFGYKSIWRFGVLVFMELFINASVQMDGVAEGILKYEFFDYVELKTGQRSEGVTTAIDNLFSKIVTRNIGQVTGNAFLSWTGFKGGYTEDGTRPPERYLKYIWPLYTLVPVLDHAIWFTCRSFVKWKPEDRERTELELAERRAAAQRLRDEAEEKVTVE